MREGLSLRMLVGAVAGATLGIAAHLTAADAPALTWIVRNVAEPIGTIFLRLLFMLVVPLIVSALALGVAGLGDVRALGRIGLRTLIYTVVVSSIAVGIGVTLVNVVRPGEGLSPALRERLAERASSLPPVTAPARTGMVDFIPPRSPTRHAPTTRPGHYRG